MKMSPPTWDLCLKVKCHRLSVRWCQEPEWLNQPGDKYGNRCYNHIACTPKPEDVTILKPECNSKQHIFFQVLQHLINQILPITIKKSNIFPFPFDRNLPRCIHSGDAMYNNVPIVNIIVLYTGHLLRGYILNILSVVITHTKK